MKYNHKQLQKLVHEVRSSKGSDHLFARLVSKLDLVLKKLEVRVNDAVLVGGEKIKLWRGFRIEKRKLLQEFICKHIKANDPAIRLKRLSALPRLFLGHRSNQVHREFNENWERAFFTPESISNKDMEEPEFFSCVSTLEKMSPPTIRDDGSAARRLFDDQHGSDPTTLPAQSSCEPALTTPNEMKGPSV